VYSDTDKELSLSPFFSLDTWTNIGNEHDDKTQKDCNMKLALKLPYFTGYPIPLIEVRSDLVS